MIAWPLVLSAALSPTRPILQNARNTDQIILEKCKGGYITHKERRLVNWLWNIYKNHMTAKALNKIIKCDFQAIDVTGNTYNKEQYIQGLLQSSKILSYQISGLKLTRTHDAIVATYVVGLELSTSGGLVLPMAQMNVFQKVDGMWKLKASGDLDIFNVLN